MTQELSVPPGFRKTILEVHGERGRAWLERLPALVAECQRRWDLRVFPPFEPLSYNYVSPAQRADGTAVVLKLGVPNPELTSEAAALRLYNGDGAVRLIDADPQAGIILEERLLPGTPLGDLADDERATAIAAQVMRQIRRPVPAGHPFPSVVQWAAGLQRLRQRYGGGTGPLETRLVERAEANYAELIASTAETVVLHGDLHHWNILSASGGAQRQPWLALDPKGLVGDPGYEVGQYLLNKIPDWNDSAQIAAIQRRRLRQFAEAWNYDWQRLCAWGIAHSVLSGFWSLEDHGYGWEEAFRNAEILIDIQKDRQ